MGCKMPSNPAGYAAPSAPSSLAQPHPAVRPANGPHDSPVTRAPWTAAATAAWYTLDVEQCPVPITFSLHQEGTIIFEVT